MKFSHEELEQWFIDHNAIPDDEDKAFVANFQVNYPDDDGAADKPFHISLRILKRLMPMQHTNQL